jgi:hypothetical protein
MAVMEKPMTSSPITEIERLRDILRRVEPHLDAIVCYASTMGEHEPNRIARDVRDALAMRSSAPPVMGMEERYRKALTPSAETKAEYIGEFSFRVPLGEDGYIEPAVPWTTIKEIMAAIRARAELSTPLVTGRE